MITQLIKCCMSFKSLILYLINEAQLHKQHVDSDNQKCPKGFSAEIHYSFTFVFVAVQLVFIHCNAILAPFWLSLPYNGSCYVFHQCPMLKSCIIFIVEKTP